MINTYYIIILRGEKVDITDVRDLDGVDKTYKCFKNPYGSILNFSLYSDAANWIKNNIKEECIADEVKESIIREERSWQLKYLK